MTRRVVRRSTFEHVQGSSVKVLENRDLPDGCCYLHESGNGSLPIPCTWTMTHVEMRVEWQWHPDLEEKTPRVKLLGFCKTHRPGRKVEGVLIELPHGLVKQINGRGQRAKMRRLESAMFVKVVPMTGSLAHLVLRSEVHLSSGQRKVYGLTTVCEKKLKSAYVPTAREERDYDDCPKCEQGKEVVRDEAAAAL
jgi:hypothetical protein